MTLEFNENTPEQITHLRISRLEELKNPNFPKGVNLLSLAIRAEITALPTWVRKCKRLRSLEVTSHALKSLPSWIGEFENLRSISLDRCAKIKSMPKSLWSLPRLESLHLFHTCITKLNGIETAPSITSLISYSDREKGAGVLAESFPQIAEKLR